MRRTLQRSSVAWPFDQSRMMNYKFAQKVRALICFVLLQHLTYIRLHRDVLSRSATAASRSSSSVSSMR